MRRLNRTGIVYHLTALMPGNFWGILRSMHDLDFVVQLPMSAMTRIVAVQAGGLDKKYLRQWAGKLKLANVLELLLNGKIRPKQT